eukprot:316603-Prorocentrum_minimum.AAC.3
MQAVASFTAVGLPALARTTRVQKRTVAVKAAPVRVAGIAGWQRPSCESASLYPSPDHLKTREAQYLVKIGSGLLFAERRVRVVPVGFINRSESVKVQTQIVGNQTT